MFRCIGKSGKTSETRKKLVKRMVSSNRESLVCTGVIQRGIPNEAHSKVETAPISQFTSIILALVKRLERVNLSALETSIEWGNSGDTRCVLFNLDDTEENALNDEEGYLDRELKINYEATSDSSRKEVDFGSKCGSMSPVYAACRAWRWADLNVAEPLKSLWFCRWSNQCIHNKNSAKENTVCINPYHWSRVTQSQSNIQDNPRIKDLIEKSKNNKITDVPDDRGNSSQNEESRESSFPFDDSVDSRPWCMLSYWELLHHIRNSWLPVFNDTYHVFVSLHTGDGLSIPDLIQQHTDPVNDTLGSSPHSPRLPLDHRCPPHHNHPTMCSACGNLLSGGSSGGGGGGGGSISGASCSSGLRITGYGPVGPSESRQVQRCRDKIGHGLTLLREALTGFTGTGRLWIYNRSDQPVFVTSPTLLSADSWEDSAVPRVVRLQPGYVMLAFDSAVYEAVEWARRTSETKGCGRPVVPGDSMNRRVVHVSFGKGWGLNYRRQDVTSCPCRLEIVIAGEGGTDATSLPEG